MRTAIYNYHNCNTNILSFKPATRSKGLATKTSKLKNSKKILNNPILITTVASLPPCIKPPCASSSSNNLQCVSIAAVNAPPHPAPPPPGERKGLTPLRKCSTSSLPSLPPPPLPSPQRLQPRKAHELFSSAGNKAETAFLA